MLIFLLKCIGKSSMLETFLFLEIGYQYKRMKCRENFEVSEYALQNTFPYVWTLLARVKRTERILKRLVAAGKLWSFIIAGKMI